MYTRYCTRWLRFYRDAQTINVIISGSIDNTMRILYYCIIDKNNIAASHTPVNILKADLYEDFLLRVIHVKSLRRSFTISAFQLLPCTDLYFIPPHHVRMLYNLTQSQYSVVLL